MKNIEVDFRQIVQDAVSDMETDMAAMLDKLDWEIMLLTQSFSPLQRQ